MGADEQDVSPFFSCTASAWIRVSVSTVSPISTAAQQTQKNTNPRWSRKVVQINGPDRGVSVRNEAKAGKTEV